MSRPTTISDETLIGAARAVFIKKGPRATTAEIAERAGVSEGILFKRFGKKATLLKATITSGMVGSWIQKEARAQAPLRTQMDFVRYICWQADLLRNVVPVVVMAWSSRSNANEMPLNLMGTKPAPLVAIQTLADMIEHEMEAGYLARRNPEAVAQMIMGSVWYFVFLDLMFPNTNSGINEETFLAELAKMVFAYVDPTREQVRQVRQVSKRRIRQ
jgi:AcrR family transcriptional regulator